MEKARLVPCALFGFTLVSFVFEVPGCFPVESGMFLLGIGCFCGALRITGKKLRLGNNEKCPPNARKTVYVR